MSVTIAVLSQKGGTGKTTTVRSLHDVLERVWPHVEVDRFAEGGHAFFAIEPTRVAERIRTFARR